MRLAGVIPGYNGEMMGCLGGGSRVKWSGGPYLGYGGGSGV